MSLTKNKKTFKVGIQQKMIIVMVSVLLLSLGISGWYTLQKQHQSIIEKTQTQGKSLARISATALAYNVIGYDYHSIQLLLDELVKMEHISYAILKNSAGNTMGESGILITNQKSWTIFNNDIIFDNKKIGALSISFDNAHIVEQLETQQETIITKEILLIVLITLGEFLAISFIIIRPIQVISTALDHNINENGSIINDIELESRDEFGLIAQQFNIMRSNLNIVTEKLHSKITYTNNELVLQNEKLLLQSSKLTEANKQLEQLTITDSLTGLYNRRYFDKLLEHELDYAARHEDQLSLIIFDIDFFKKINDKYGHSVGDLVLTRIGDILLENLRKLDIACRIGGEEFGIICRHTNFDESKITAEKLRCMFEETKIDLNKKHISITASFGIITFPDAVIVLNSPDELYHQADIAMYYSKENGRNRVSHIKDIDSKQLNLIVT